MPYEAGHGARFDAATAAMLASSTAVSEPAVQTSLKQKPVSGGPTSAHCRGAFRQSVRASGSLAEEGREALAEQRANAILGALVDRLRVAAEESRKAENAAGAARLAALGQQLAAAKARSNEIGRALRSVRDALENGGDPTYAIPNLRSQKRQLGVQLAPLKARLAALEDESVDACEAKAALAEKALAKLKERNKRGKAAVELIADAERLAEAREKLATARAMAPSLQNRPLITPTRSATSR